MSRVTFLIIIWVLVLPVACLGEFRLMWNPAPGFRVGDAVALLVIYITILAFARAVESTWYFQRHPPEAS